MCRLAAAHKAIRLMLLGLPPDMVHGVLLHRARTSIFRNFSTLLKELLAPHIIISYIRIFVKFFLQIQMQEAETTALACI